MNKKHLICMTLVAVSLCSVAFAARAAVSSSPTSTPAKPAKDAGVTKFVKIWTEAKALNDSIGTLVQAVGEQMNSLAGFNQADYYGKLKVVNKSISQVTSALALVDKQNIKLASLKKTAATIKNAKIKASGVRLAGDYIAVYKLLKDMIKAEKDVLVLIKNELTLQSKGKPASADYSTKINVLLKKITDANDKIAPLGQDADAAQAEFESLAGVTLAK